MKIKQQMAIGHNLNASDLAFANKIGGFVCPSLAIFRTDHAFTNYGDITLLMDKSKVNFRSTPAHNADVFSARFPLCYYKADVNKLDSFTEEVNSACDDLAEISSIVDYHESSAIQKGFESVASTYMNDLKVLMTYARDKGLNPRTYKATNKSGIIFIDSNERPKSFLKKLKAFEPESLSEGTDEYAHYSQFIYDTMVGHIDKLVDSRGGTKEEKEADKEYFLSRTRKSYFKEVDGKPILFFNTYQKLNDYIRLCQRNPNPIDRYKTNERLRKLVSTDKQKEAFKGWLNERIGKAFHSPFMYVLTRSGNQKKLAFTAENALKAMKGKVNGEEQTIFMGAGSIRSLVAKNYRSIREITKNIDMLVSEKEMKKVGDEFNSRLQEFPDKLAPFYLYQTDSWRYRDAVYEEIADYAKRGTTRALESFKDIPDEVLEDLNNFLDELSNAVTHYFEIKEQSIVGLDKFDAAIVPKGTHKETLEILRNANVKVTFYEPDNKLSRQLGVIKNQPLLFGNGEEVTLNLSEDSPELEL